jgi:RND family efflux transporter MFP subunit
MQHEDVSPKPQPSHQPGPSPDEANQQKKSGHGGIKWFLLIPVLLAIFGALTLFLRTRSNKVLAASTQSMEAESVTVTHPQPGKPDNDLLLPSTLQAYSQSPIYARTSGYLAHWYADIGTHVHQGQLLAVIASPELDQQLAQARAGLSQTQANLALAQVSAQRTQELIHTNAVPQQLVDQNNQNLAAQNAGLQASQANVRQLEALQGFERVTAPFDGIITQRLTDVGNLINAGNSGVNSQLFTLAKINVIRVFVPVPEIYSSQITNGLHATLNLIQLAHQTFTGTVTRSSHAIDLASHTLLTEIDVPNPTGKLLPGAYATVHLHLAAGVQPLTVPIGAVLFQAAGPQVASVNGNKQVELHKVTIGRDFGNTIEITGGLSANDEIIASPPDYLVNGMPVTVQPPAGQQSATDAKSSSGSKS